MAETVRVEEAYTERDETIDAKGNVTEIEKHTKKAAELLKGMDGGGSMTFQ